MTINTPISSAIDDFVNNRNTQYGKLNAKAIAQKMLKESVDAGSAIVNILSATGIAGFKFHVPETEQIRLENEITDQYTDINSPIQDHVAGKPVFITLSGLVGDYFYSNNKIEDMLALITPTITLVKEFIPQLTEASKRQKIQHSLETVQIKNGLKEININVKGQEYQFNAVDLFTLFQQLYKLKSAQVRAFLFFEALWKSRSLFTVETTWKRYDNMVIQNVTAKRDKNADITDFSVTFKQMDFTQSLSETIDEYKNRMEQQKASVVDKGTVKGVETPVTQAINNIVN